MAFVKVILILNVYFLLKICTVLSEPVKSDYTPEGQEWTFKDLKVYESKNTQSKTLLFGAYDIFGFSNTNTRQIADKIASKTGFRVSMPDFFRGKPWKLEDWPIKNQKDFDKWIATTASWDVAKSDLRNLIQYYKGQGVTSFGIFGWCWGGKVSEIACTDISEILAGGLIHPSAIETKEADAVKSPMFILNCSDEPDLVPFFNTLVSKFGSQNCGHHLFTDVKHGFAGANSNFDNPLVKTRVEQVIEFLQSYFKRQLKK